jgi:hypothetical protein
MESDFDDVGIREGRKAASSIVAQRYKYSERSTVG